MFEPDRLKHLLEDRVTVGKGLEEPPLRGLKEVPAPFSLPSLIAWLKTQDPAEMYCYTNQGACLWSRYTKAHGGSWGEGETGYQIGPTNFPNHYHFRISEPRYALAVSQPWNFGSALQRALVLQANAVRGSSPILISEGV